MHTAPPRSSSPVLLSLHGRGYPGSHLVQLLPATAQVLQGEVPDDGAVVPAAHVHHQAAAFLVGVDLVQREHGLPAVPDRATLRGQTETEYWVSHV